MAKTAVAVPDPVQARRAVIERVLARQKPPEARYALDPKTGQTIRADMRVTGDGERLAPADLGEWADDRTLACFGGRTGLRAAEAAAFGILGAMRSGDPDAVRAAVRAAGHGLDEWQPHNLLYPLLQTWQGKAPGFALPVASAATAEARRLGWDQRPKRRRQRRVTLQDDLDGPPGDAVAPATERLFAKAG